MSYSSNQGEQRREERIPATRRATARLALSLELRDVSVHGLQARCSLPLAAGTMIKFTLPGGVETHARVVWYDGEHVGCDLLRPLSSSEMDSVTAAAPDLHG
jgi:hypothetical protein